MKQLADWVIVEWFGRTSPDKWAGTPVVYVLLLFLVAAVVMGFVCVFAGPITVVERRVAGRIMSRIGPNRVGPQGMLQWLADGLKLFLKEDLIPCGADDRCERRNALQNPRPGGPIPHVRGGVDKSVTRSIASFYILLSWVWTLACFKAARRIALFHFHEEWGSCGTTKVLPSSSS